MVNYNIWLRYYYKNMKAIRNLLKPLKASLHVLSILNLSSCKCIELLWTMIGQLHHLTYLWLQECENLKKLPQSIASLFSLSILDLSYCRFIESLPIASDELKHLTKLWSQRCENPKELPQTIASLLIININLSYYKSIKSLSTTIG